MNNNIYEITLDSHAFGGEVFGRLPDGKAVFVPYSIPGEKVRIRLVEDKRGYAKAECLEVLSPSSQRVSARCKHFGVCGGCHYQHMSYQAQIKAKAAIVKDQLERIGRISNPKVLETVPCPDPWHYRNHVQFHLMEEGNLGFMASHSKTTIAIEECHLPQPAINELWLHLDLEPIPGLQRVGLREGSDGELMLILESSDPYPPEFSVDFPLSAMHLGPDGPVLLAGSDFLQMTILERNFRVSGESFFQVNTLMAEKMVSHLLEQLTLTSRSRVLDVYCGVGLFSAFLAEKAGRVTGIESAPEACYDFEINLDEFDNVELYEAPAEVVLPNLDIDADIVVVDPPRTGLEPAVTDAILSLAPETLVYISCDPATLARDARRLAEGGYNLIQVTPFDLFPQTYHIETISLWRKIG